MKQWIDPKNDADQFEENDICRMFLPNMKQLMAEYLLALFTIDINTAVPENRFKKRKRCARFAGFVEINIQKKMKQAETKETREKESEE